MRFHRLEIEAFGPFAERQSVDFDELSAAGLFLLNGETGAGKTSVLDAICFALYGGLPGARAGSTRLRSDHAPASATPEVVCEFSTGGRRFEVTRSPAWDRPKARGTGTTKQQAQSRLRELVHGDWVEKSTRNDEVSTELTEILGMGKDQFTKVAMLPQGEFAAFLRSKDTDREALLQRLFDTTTYAAVERLLAAQLAEVRAAAEQAERTLDAAVGQLREDADSTLGDGPVPEEPSPEESVPDAPARHPALALVAAVGDRLARRTHEAGDAVRAAEARERAARADLEAIGRRAEDHRQLADLEERRGRHAAGTEAVAGLRAALATHARAAGVVPLAEALDRAEDAAGEAASVLGRAADRARADDLARAHLEASSPGGQVPDAGAPDAGQQGVDGPGALEVAAAGAAQAATEAAAVLAAALPDEDSLRELDTLIADERGGLAAGQQAVQAALAARDGAQAGLPGLKAEVDRLVLAGASRGTLEAARHAAAGVLAAVRERATAQAAAARAGEALLASRKDTLDRREELIALGRLELAQAAAGLAARLVDGEPCAVCGSAQHPAPAVLPAGEAVGEKDHERARQRLEAAEAREARDRASLDAAQADLARVLARAGTLPEADAEAALAEAEEAAAVASAAADGLEAARSALAAAERESQAAAERLAAGQARMAAAQAALGQLESRRRELDGKLAGLRSGHASLRERHAAVADAAEALGGLETAARRSREARAAAAAARIRCAEALAEAGFGSVEDQRAALLPAAALAEATARVQDHDDEGVRLAALEEADAVVRARADLARGVAAPSGAALEEAAEQADGAAADRDAALRSAAVLDAFAGRCAAASRRIADLVQAQGPALERYDTVRSVAELVRGAGENRYKMTLSTYVLAARLEAVAAAATERLLVMTSERYTLVHDDSKKGNNKSGLGLHVVDAWTGQRRDTSTLSGGESFMASLALALGLADVVQQESGGVDMETLFVDEGFGSLDERTLEQVMDALDGLRRGGRVVGLVSHVADMKQRIPVQLRVSKGREGSRLGLAPDAGGIL